LDTFFGACDAAFSCLQEAQGALKYVTLIALHLLVPEVSQFTEASDKRSHLGLACVRSTAAPPFAFPLPDFFIVFSLSTKLEVQANYFPHSSGRLLRKHVPEVYAGCPSAQYRRYNCRALESRDDHERDLLILAAVSL